MNDLCITKMNAHLDKRFIPAKLEFSQVFHIAKIGLCLRRNHTLHVYWSFNILRQVFTWCVLALCFVVLILALLHLKFKRDKIVTLNDFDIGNIGILIFDNSFFIAIIWNKRGKKLLTFKWNIR